MIAEPKDNRIKPALTRRESRPRPKQDHWERATFQVENELEAEQDLIQGNSVE
jgi:hypothetical protein